MRLYIAEKPSLGRAIAEVLPKPHIKNNSYIKVGNGDIVSWCIGHLLEQAPPEAYNPAFKKWHSSHLPIIPETWQLRVKEATKKQFNTLITLIKKADTLVNVGDPDREGQLLIDEVIHYAGVSKHKLQSTKRCLISDLNSSSIKKSLSNLRSNTDFIPLSTSALVRTRADWLYGINLTRLCTLKGQKQGYNSVLSIGRVQTPVLGLVVRRDHEIENFISKEFYELDVTLISTSGNRYEFKAKWKPSEACQPYMDEENRVLSRKLVEKVAAKVFQKTGHIEKFSNQIKKQPPPLPYNLSSLQIEASNLFQLSAQQVLDTCQSLYEKHKLITYPRSDCRYLPIALFNQSRQTLQAVCQIQPALTETSSSTRFIHPSRAWNDKKVTAHHAIIPTLKSTAAGKLSDSEFKVYDLVARQYLMQFLPDYEYRHIQIDSRLEGGLFCTRKVESVSLGWKVALYRRPNESENKALDKTPALKPGDAVTCLETHIRAKNTTPPNHFNDATLLSAMTGISRFVSDPSIRKVLRETDGIGTEATRASIIELLLKRGFLTRQKKHILSTKLGRQLIQSLPSYVTLPDMTAHWESKLEKVSNKKLCYQDFMEPMITELKQLIGYMNTMSFKQLENDHPSQRPKKIKKRVSKKAGLMS